MSEPEPLRPTRIAPREALAALFVFGLFFLWIRLAVDPGLISRYQSPAFLTTFGFLRDSFTRPGGPLDYVSAFAWQFSAWPTAGALILTLLAMLTWLATRRLLNTVAGRDTPPWLACVPVLLLLMLHGRYDYRPEPTFALLAALVFTNLYARRAADAAGRRIAAFAGLYLLLYYVAGGVAVLFAVLAAVVEWARERRAVWPRAFVISAPLAPLIVAACAVDLGVRQAFVNLIPYRPEYMSFRTSPGAEPAALRHPLLVLSLIHGTLMLFIPLAAAAVVAFGRKLRSPAASWTPVSLGIFLLASVCLTWLSFDVGAGRRIAVDDFAARGEWQRVLESAKRVPSDSYDVGVMHEVNRALFHAGRLPWDMCDYPQCVRPPTLHLAPDEKTSVSYAKLAEIHFELGNENFAEGWAHTAMEIEGPSPGLLLLLARINALKGRPEAARALAGTLAQNLLWHRRAQEFRRMLDADPALTHDPQVSRAQAFLLLSDRGFGALGGLTYDQPLRDLLAANPQNRMAFEYLIAYDLLTRNLDRFSEDVKLIGSFDYPGIPALYEQALCLQQDIHPDLVPDLPGRRISVETEARFRLFLPDLDRWRAAVGPRKEFAAGELTRKWGSTYFFFYVMGRTEPHPGWRMSPTATP